MDDVSIICAHGIGDAILGMQCASFVDLHGDEFCEVIACCRDEVFNVLRCAFGEDYYPRLIQHPEKEKWGEDNWILKNPGELEKCKSLEKVYYVIPDLLHRNPFAFDWRRYKVSPQTIKSTRLLTDRWEPKKRIYVGLASSHPDYQFSKLPELLYALGANFPDYEIYYPNLQRWNGKPLPYGALTPIEKYPDNVVIDSECVTENVVEKLRTSDYGIFVDNGFSHLAYQIGVPRLVLDHHYGNILFESRWRENNEDYIPYTEKIDEILSVVYNNLTEPATLLINKNYLKRVGVDWSKALLFKY